MTNHTDRKAVTATSQAHVPEAQHLTPACCSRKAQPLLLLLFPGPATKTKALMQGVELRPFLEPWHATAGLPMMELRPGKGKGLSEMQCSRERRIVGFSMFFSAA